MQDMRSAVDPDGLLEYSVVFTDRSLNHMSAAFQSVMRDISVTLTKVYGADCMAIVPGGGTFGMEAVARQLGTGKNCLVLRNGWFSYRWSQIFDAGSIPANASVLMARQVSGDNQAAFEPAPIAEVVQHIRETKPHVVFAPHVETSAGLMLPDDYIREVGAAVSEVGGLFVLDCIASGAVWVDMGDCKVDVLISAPQKGWSASPCGALVMMNTRAREVVANSKSTSFAGDLKKWAEIMDAYTNGGHAYHATMPTDALVKFHATMEAIVKPTMQMAPESLNASQMERLSNLAAQAEEEWQHVEAAEFDLALFGKSEAEQAQFASLLAAERDAISRLVAAIQKNDKAAVIKAGKGLKPPFAKVYMYFGDFPQQARVES